jgi:hypothetical protein
MSVRHHDPATCPCNRCVARRQDERLRAAEEATKPAAAPSAPPAGLGLPEVVLQVRKEVSTLLDAVLVSEEATLEGLLRIRNLAQAALVARGLQERGAYENVDGWVPGGDIDTFR